MNNHPLSAYRNDFPMLKKSMHGKPLIYFDTAATSQKPQIVIDTIRDFYENHYGTVHRAIYELSIYATQEYRKVRQKVQNFLGARLEEEIIFTRGTTESINLVAYSFGKAFVTPGDEIIISQIEHHSNIVPWQILCEDRKAILRIIPVNDRGELNLEKFAEILNPKTKLVALAHVSNSLGTIHPIQEVVKMARKVGAKVLVDGAQAASHLSVDVDSLGADFYVFSGHKLYGPTGIGVLYGKKELLDLMPPYQGGGDMISKVTFENTSYNVLPLKFEAGTPMIAEVLGLGAAIDYLNRIGLPKIHKWEQELLHYATSQLKEIPNLRILGNARNKSAIISFIVEGIHPLDLGTLLDLQGVAIRTGHHCAQPTMDFFCVPSTARISFGLYNTKEEIDQFIVILKKAIEKLRT